MTDCLNSVPEKRPTFEELDLQLKRLDAATMEPVGLKTQRKDRTDALLFEVFPKPVAEALRDGRKVEPLSRDIVTVCFSDIVGYTDISSSLTPTKVADLLRRLYSQFDELSSLYGVKKIETIGDSYMAVTNLTEDQGTDHAKRIADFAMAIIEAANDTLIDTEAPDRGFVDLRVGFSSGPVVADVVGSLSPRWCLFGDVVNTASRMESNSKKNKIHCSDASAKILKKQYPALPLRRRGMVEIKGKGTMTTWWVNDTDDTSSSGGAPNSPSGAHGIHLADLQERVRNYLKPSSCAGPTQPSTGTSSWAHVSVDM